MTSQARNALIAILAIAAVILGVLAYFGFRENGWFAPLPPSNQPTTTPPGNSGTTGTPFNETGNLVKDNPGLPPGVWHLLYDEPGQAAATVQLVFNNASRCNTDGQAAACETMTFAQGQRATVVGTKTDGSVTVSTLTRTGVATNDNIRVTAPQPDAAVSSPLRVEGQARGTWYFEASFPVRIVDANGKQLGIVPAQAQGEWMTTEFVPFVANLTFTTPTTETGTLILEKDNPSGLPENADEIRIPVRFNVPQRTVKLYYYNAANDTDESGNIQCSREGLVAVDRQIPVTTTPIQDAIRLLLRGQLTSAERAQGVSTEFPLAGVELKGATLSNGVLTLEFADPQNRTSGGSCRAGILWNQIEATAKQFSEVRQVRFIPEELFQP